MTGEGKSISDCSVCFAYLRGLSVQRYEGTCKMG
ncbi:unnamed protein product, partial [Vitis vinifera]